VPRSENRHDEATVAICQKAAGQGLPTAQLALAQIHSARRSGPKDQCSKLSKEQRSGREKPEDSAIFD